MPKQKTKKGIAKRFKITGTGKIKHYGAGGSHLLSKKSSSRKRRLKKGTLLEGKKNRKTVKRLLPYG